MFHTDTLLCTARTANTTCHDASKSYMSSSVIGYMLALIDDSLGS
jgi:hypothetical protein